MDDAKIELARAMLKDMLPDTCAIGELCNGCCDECESYDCDFGASVKIDREEIQFKVREK